jgi:hypothetical protein
MQMVTQPERLMKILNKLGNGFFFITVPIWWSVMVAIEVVQILIYRPPVDKLLGQAIYNWLQRDKKQSA